ncbi:putative D-tyrosyl-tRNA deacylase [Catenaria anguillulae PL171]|uniref:D-aminoacyl-tRNA deacylase n=1 Tax=Catenaria anguillulae PL171 TaxID=765915 RepID=A0A1Y2HZX3_9FUNG|nr:putative D-tyrosyl-tRNA deacylase [Catenaria anguillulae PL171]
MRAVIQCVSSASVTVDSQVISSISRGLMVLVGLAHDDTQDDVDYIVRKLLNSRLFPDPDSGAMWKKSAKDLDLEVLCVSQFTLYGNLAKGNKPDFHASMRAEQAKETYAGFLEKLRNGYGNKDRIKDGQFQAMMQVALVNEGPITLTLDSRIRK